MVATSTLIRDQIRICRVLCIFFMMSVHVSPGRFSGEAHSPGVLDWAGHAWVDLLGRASVATLSFISGYLLVMTAAHLQFRVLALKKARTLLLPMLTWNLLFCGLLVVKTAVLGADAEGRSIAWHFDAATLGALTGLTGPTANTSLFFLRDLFVSSLIIFAMLPILRRWPVCFLLMFGLMSVYWIGEPLIFRPPLLFFVGAGAVAAQRLGSLTEISSLRIMGPYVLVAATGLLLVSTLPDQTQSWVGHALDLFRRCLLIAAALWLSAKLVGTRAGTAIAPVETYIFETYLLHASLIALLWLPWRLLVGGADDPSYFAFFVLAPVVAICVGAVVGRVTDKLPVSLQFALRGRTARPRESVSGTKKSLLAATYAIEQLIERWFPTASENHEQRRHENDEALAALRKLSERETPPE